MTGHPAGSAHPGPALGCARDGCDGRAVARLLIPTDPYGKPVLAYVRPLTATPVGTPVCAEHTHHLIDMMLMATLPPGAGPAAETTT